MKIFVHIGPDASTSERLQQILDAKRGQLARHGVLYARSPNARNHTRLFMAVSDPDNVDLLRHNRGFADPVQQAALAADLQSSLSAEIAKHHPHTLILFAHQLGSTLANPKEIMRLRDMLSAYSNDIHIRAHVENPATMLFRRYATQLIEGRGRSLRLEMRLIQSSDWWQAALDTRPHSQPELGIFPEMQSAVFWLDYQRLVKEWDAVFGEGATALRGIDTAVIWSEMATEELCSTFEIDRNIGKAEVSVRPPLPSAAWLTRIQQFNDALLRWIKKDDLRIPRQLWKAMLNEIAVQGPQPEYGRLHKISERFQDSFPALVKAHPALTEKALQLPSPALVYAQADPMYGFRATQYLSAFRYRIERLSAEAKKAEAQQTENPDEDMETKLSHSAKAVFTPLAKQKYASLSNSAFAPHNRLRTKDSAIIEQAYSAVPTRALPKDRTGNVIVACMKNEAPYIVEWIAYHRAIGIDTFLIYTNGCEDSTDPILQQLENMGIVHHRRNDHWTGNSPQQFALDAAMQDPVVLNSDWIIHIDVDEYINVRCGNGTIQDFLERVPDASNVAMTWRLFGHNGVSDFQDKFVIDQFDGCAPAYCPKPHTVWGFKSMTRNIGAYEKLSCHRPNKLSLDKVDQVKWVNGSGQDMTNEVIKNGWRNSKRSIGYDLLQLNHYALRSAESFLVKRQRGRALHVDRSIGLNYWVRMDWNLAKDVSIKRNIPRLRAEYDRLMQDKTLDRLHQEGVHWHKAKAAELHKSEDFEALFQQALKLELTDTERAAFSLALDVES